jgi:predicted GNAT family acetyltransferase
LTDVRPERESANRGVTVRDNPAELRYEALVDGDLIGEIRYRTEPGAVVLIHTEVAPSAEDTGVGSQLVEQALDDIRARRLHVVPLCPFVAAYIRRHPGYADLVVADPATPA